MQADFRDDYAEAARLLRPGAGPRSGERRPPDQRRGRRVAMGDVAGARPLADRLEAADPSNQVAALVRLGDALAAGDFDAAGDVLAAAGETLNPLLGGLLAGWIEVGRDDFAAAQAKFDAMTGNDALDRLRPVPQGAGARASPATSSPPRRSSPAARTGRCTSTARRSSPTPRSSPSSAARPTPSQLIDEALAGGVPDAPLLDLRDRLAAGEEVPFDQVTGAARRRGGGLPDPRRRAQHRGIRSGSALVHARLAAHIRPDLVEAAARSPPRSSRPRTSTRSPPRRSPPCPRTRPGT